MGWGLFWHWQNLWQVACCKVTACYKLENYTQNPSVFFCLDSKTQLNSSNLALLESPNHIPLVKQVISIQTNHPHNRGTKAQFHLVAMGIHSSWCSSPLLLPFLLGQLKRTPTLSTFGGLTKTAKSLLKPHLKFFFLLIHHFSIQIPWIFAWVGPFCLLQANHVYMEAWPMGVGPA